MYYKQPKPIRIGWAQVGVLGIRMEVEEDSEGNLEDRLERLPDCTLPRKCPPSLCLVWIPSGIIEGIPLWSPQYLR